ncbi:glycoside hydrolase family 88/105 protein [Oribacterium sp. Sow4_G1_1]|uniref:glycoside hydrolase family 88/105 protein n=1 Tax=Oribacterium sp. Sow4_G1_1 TaxID=3438794 RepID=UPI003F99E2A8
MDQKRHHLQGDRAATVQLLDEYIDYLMAHSDSAHPAWNLEMIRSWKSNKWNYIDGCMITGILERYEITGEARFLDFADRFLSGFVEEDGRIRTYDPAEYSLDNVNPAKNLFTLYDLTGKEKYRKALELVRSQLSTMPRTPEGNFWHKLIYPNQVWLDGIYMALPFYMEYEKRFDAQKDCEDICRQIANVEIRMRDPKTGLYYHGYDASRKMYWADPDTGCSPNFWLRAEGWFILGLVDVLEIMKDLPMGAESVHLQHMLLDLAKALSKYQDPSGLWYQLIALPELAGNYLETSGTALISAALLKAVRLGFLPESFRAVGEKAFYGIVDHRLTKNADGTPCVTGICLVGGLGGEQHRDGSAAYYLSEPVVQNDAKGVGPLLLAYTEMLR